MLMILRKNQLKFTIATLYRTVEFDTEIGNSHHVGLVLPTQNICFVKSHKP